jgi:hypothetical protein
MAKVVFLNWEPDQGQFQMRNALFDDGGAYVSELHVHKDRDWFEDQRWFQEIRDKVTSDELHQNWGLHGPRVQYIFQDRFMGTYFKTLLWVDGSFVGDLSKTYTLSLFAFPILVLIKFMLLLLLCAPRHHVQLILWNLTHDVLNIPPIPGSEHSAVQLLLLGLGLLFFGKKSRGVTVASWVIMALACLLNPIPWAPVLAVILVLIPQLERFWSKIDPWFLLISVAGMAFLVLVPLAHLALNILSHGTGAHTNTDATILTRNLVYIDLSCLFLILALHWAPRWRPVLDGSMLQVWKRLTMALVLGAGFISLVSPWLHFEIWENSWRYQRYILIVLLGGFATLLGGLDPGTWRRPLNTTLVLAFCVLLVGSFMNRVHPGQPLGWSNRIERIQKFEAHHLPTKLPRTGQLPVFSAESPQQVYGYFIEKRYEEGPLILEIESARYQPDSWISSPGEHVPK